jgi:predicted ATPase/DNA-binding winged helix-turn-helix (wHTH) protein
VATDDTSAILDGDRSAYRFGPYLLLPARRQLLLKEEPVKLGDRAFDLLALLVARHGDTVAHADIRQRVWSRADVDETSIRAQLHQLRRALGTAANGDAYVRNVRGRGYRFSQNVQVISEAAALGGRRHDMSVRVPPRHVRMLGRQASLDLLCEQARTNRLVTVVGPGGIGKTTLAIEACHRVRRRFADEIFFVELGSLPAPDLILPTLADAFDYRAQIPHLLQGLAAFLEDRSVLLVLDCCEHVVDQVADIASTLFRLCPRLHILATSREPLRADGEILHLLDPLELPLEEATTTAQRALGAPAIQLFLQRAAASGYVGDLRDEDAATAEEICRRLDGVPLALELAGSRLPTYGFQGLADILRSRSILNWPGSRGDPRHRSLEVMLDWSFQLLGDLDRRVLTRLAVFKGAFSIKAAEFVANLEEGDRWAITQAVENLVDRSLLAIRVSGGMHFYRMLDVTRYYTDVKLRESDEYAALTRKHALLCLLDLKSAFATDIGGGGAPAPAGVEIGDVRTALERSFAPGGDRALGIELASYATGLFRQRSMLQESRKWAELALGALADTPVDDPRCELRLQEALAVSAMFTAGNSDLVLGAIERGLDLATSLGEQGHKVHLLTGLNLFLTRREDLLGALEAAERLDAVARASDDPRLTVAADWMLASAQHLIGHEVLAEELNERGYARADAFGIRNLRHFDYDHLSRAAITRALLAWIRGKPDLAARYCREVIDMAMATRHPVTICIVLTYTAPVIVWLRDLAWADQVCAELLGIASKHALRPYITGATALRGEILLAQGRAEDSLGLLRGAIDALRADQQRLVLSQTLRAYAEAHARAGFHDEADRILSDLIQHAQLGHPTSLMPELYRTLGLTHHLAGQDPTLAQHWYERAINCAKYHGAPGFELKVALSLADLLVMQGRMIEVRDLLKPLCAKFADGLASKDICEARMLLARAER